jgi:hypothetical protein
MRLLSIGFEFREAEYHAIIRIKEKETGTEYHVTIMNGELEKTLYGNHIITEKNGELQFDTRDTEIGQLKYNITEALDNYLKLTSTT